MSLFNRNEKPGDTAARQQSPQQSPQPSPATPAKPNPQGMTPQAAQPQPAPSLATPQKSASGAPASSPSPAKQTSIPTPAKTGVSMASVISKALKITGELESTEDIQIDGQIEGDVRGVGVKIGENAKVKGSVYGDEVELAGSIEGKIESKRVILTSTARMTGDVFHQDIKIESGAFISGSLRPDLGKADARQAPKPVAVASSSSAPVKSETPALAAKG
jgi:cytoskeletal protein CcmA (bactofilin family)